MSLSAASINAGSRESRLVRPGGVAIPHSGPSAVGQTSYSNLPIIVAVMLILNQRQSAHLARSCKFDSARYRGEPLSLSFRRRMRLFAACRIEQEREEKEGEREGGI